MFQFDQSFVKGHQLVPVPPRNSSQVGVGLVAGPDFVARKHGRHPRQRELLGGRNLGELGTVLVHEARSGVVDVEPAQNQRAFRVAFSAVGYRGLEQSSVGANESPPLVSKLIRAPESQPDSGSAASSCVRPQSVIATMTRTTSRFLSPPVVVASVGDVRTASRTLREPSVPVVDDRGAENDVLK